MTSTHRSEHGHPRWAPEGDVVVGVDGARGGWVGVVLPMSSPPPDPVRAVFAPTLVDLVDAVGPVGVLGVDMPVALAVDGRRSAEVAARPLLGPRRASLFASPARGALAFGDDDYAAANAWSKATCGRGMSKQAWFLVPKIREVRALVVDPDTGPAATTATGAIVAEVLPELSFLALHGEPLPAPKTTWTGLARRVRLLAEAGIHLPEDPGPAGRVAPDDMVDAAAVAWSARRIATGTARRVPDGGDEPAIWW